VGFEGDRLTEDKKKSKKGSGGQCPRSLLDKLRRKSRTTEKGAGKKGGARDLKSTIAAQVEGGGMTR